MLISFSPVQSHSSLWKLLALQADNPSQVFTRFYKVWDNEFLSSNGYGEGNSPHVSASKFVRYGRIPRVFEGLVRRLRLEVD